MKSTRLSCTETFAVLALRPHPVKRKLLCMIRNNIPFKRWELRLFECTTRLPRNLAFTDVLINSFSGCRRESVCFFFFLIFFFFFLACGNSVTEHSTTIAPPLSELNTSSYCSLVCLVCGRKSVAPAHISAANKHKLPRQLIIITSLIIIITIIVWQGWGAACL